MTPETRPSLIMRLRQGDDSAAWEEFVVLYQPVLIRFGQAQGLQFADAEDLAQQVLMNVVRRIQDWEWNPERAKFSTWLGRMVRNGAVNLLTRKRLDQGMGGTTATLNIREIEQPSAKTSALEKDWRQQIFLEAAAQARRDVEPATWQAFWLSAVEGLPAADVARRTGKTIGAVYVAKTRIMQRIQRIVQLMSDDSGEEPRE